ncbi:16S rRNA (cytosine(1402)-N(4))-methyltransferase RsmH [Geopsychrobacter electrodiphilus]|uniref:16S rRNA (cytosine(1402)-N(4))-methyltransferase RsmH n=1 Tax=Geopsychrobacter electrodiphilus TaxID=225196 RepID=UPI0004757904
MLFEHQSVMPREVIDLLQPVNGGIYLDGTLGGAGHSRLILDTAPQARLIGIDRDRSALAKAQEVLAGHEGRFSLHHQTFDRAGEVLQEFGIDGLDGMLLDLGVSSHQLDTAERGFSFRFDAPLDMRMDCSAGPTAADLVNELPEDELVRIFFQYGEERFSRRVARAILKRRETQPFTRTGELAELLRAVIPGGRKPSRIDPATRVFQAIRIAVNQELDQVEQGVKRGIELLKPGGRLVVISFHSLEDRIVKHIFREQARGCICPPRILICQCNNQPAVEILTRKGLKPQADEIEVNPRSRSAVLRAISRIG